MGEAVGREPARALQKRVAMDQLLRFTGSVKREPAIEAWMNGHPGDLGAIARHWFEVIRGCGDDVRELLHDGCPTACVGDAGFAYVNAFTGHVNVGFFRGAGLRDPNGLLEGTGKVMRHVKLRPGREVDATALLKLVTAAYADMKGRLAMTDPAKPRVTSLAPQFLVDDLERSIAYYQRLGFHFGEPWGGFYAIGRLNGLELHLKEAPKNPADRRYRRDHEHLDAAAGVEGIEAFYDQCVANGATILKPLEETPWGTKDFYIEDPDGYIVSFGGRAGGGA